MNQTRPKSK